jgi:putative MATE family efflux protein
MPGETRRAVRARVLGVAVPYVIESLFDTLMFYADMIMLGQYSNVAMASLGVAGPITYTLALVFGALRVGIIATVSRDVGEGNAEKQRRSAAAGLVLAVRVGVIGSILGLTLIPQLTQLFPVRDRPELGGLAFLYIQVTATALVFSLVQISAAAVLRAAGQTRLPMAVGIVANLINVGGNYVLIFGKFGFPEMGVLGAALATAASQAFYAAACVVFLFTRRSPIRLGWADFRRATGADQKRILRVALPAAIEPVILQTGFLVFIKIVTALGFVALAAHRAAIALEALTFMPGNAMALACSALVGQALGARRPREAELAFHESARLAMYFMSAIGVAFVFAGADLMSIFLSMKNPAERLDNEVIQWTGALVLAIVSLSEPFFSNAMVLAGALRGAGDTKSPVLVAVVGVWLVRIPCAYVLAIPLGLGLAGIWTTMVIDWFVRMGVLWYIFKRGRWKEIKV